jgi:hypothetical protein
VKSISIWKYIRPEDWKRITVGRFRSRVRAQVYSTMTVDSKGYREVNCIRPIPHKS